MDTKSLDAVLADLVKRMGDAAVKYGPDAVNAVQKYMHLQGILYICLGLALWGVAAGLISMAFRCARLEQAEGEENPIYIFGIVFGSFGALLAGIIGAINLFNADNWLVALDSRMALVQLAIRAVGHN